MQPKLLITIPLTVTLISSSALLIACSSNLNQTEKHTDTEFSRSQKNGQTSESNKLEHHTSMDLGPADNDYDLRFIDAMKLHHQGAVKMAKEAQQKSQRPEVQKLAQEIINTQDTEIEQMAQWKKNWYPNASNTPMAYHSQMGHQMPMSSEQIKEMTMDINLGKADQQFDLRFIEAMISHHEGAITMASDAKNKSKRPEIQELSDNIITSQQQEIEQMKQWEKAWYNQ